MRFHRLFLLVALVAALLTPPPAESREHTRDDAHDPSLAGQFLIAAPGMRDPRFARTVIYMLSHDADGAMGLVVNRAYGTGPLKVLLRTLGVDAAEASGTVRLRYGGPVEPSRGFVLHSDDFSGPSTKRVGTGLAVSFGTDVLRAIAAGKGPRRNTVILGYAGWGPGQLEREIAREDWLTAPANAQLIFSEDLDALWKAAIDSVGLSL